MKVTLTETQLKLIQDYVEALNSSKNKDNYFIGKCGEVAVLNYGNVSGLFCNFYGNDLTKSILQDSGYADNGYDVVMQSKLHPYIRLLAQVKTTASKNGNNLLLDKKLYDPKLVYYNNLPQDVFILVKQIDLSTYDILGFILHDDAVKCYKADFPVKGCYCIDRRKLKPIEQLNAFLV